MKAGTGMLAAALLAACAAPRSAREEGAALRLENLAQLRTVFNEHPDRRRVVVLASPT